MTVSARIIKKIVFRIPIIVESPIHIGSGIDNGITDLLVLKDEEGMPFIPATSLAGVLRQHIRNVCTEADADFLFGSRVTEQINQDGDCLYGQSRINIQDTMLKRELKRDENGKDSEEQSVRVVDSVAIDDITGVGIDGAKYDYEVVESGVTGMVKMEITERQTDCQQGDVLRLAKVLAGFFITGFQVGAMTSKGYGMIRYQDRNANLYYVFDFSEPNQFENWKQYINTSGKKLPDPNGRDGRNWHRGTENNFIPEDELCLDMYFDLKSSLLIRDYDCASDGVQAAQFQWQNNYVIPGTSLKGVFRHSAKHILQQCMTDEDKVISMLNDLMGYSNGKVGEEAKGQKSRLSIQEVHIAKSAVRAQKHTRNRIDRFTGETIQGALFTEEPIWKLKNQQDPIHIHLNVSRCTLADAGLLLIVMKGLWLGDIAIGGGKAIGRGILCGRKAKMQYKGWRIEIDGGKTLTIQGSRTDNGKQVPCEGEQCMAFMESCVQAIGGENNGR